MEDAGYTASDVEELKDLLSLISNTAGGTVVLDESDLGQAALPLIQSDFVQDKKFTYVSSVEELESEMRRAASERDISECIIHHSDSFTNTNWSAEDIDEMNTTFGHSEIVYHYVIKRDGSIQRGRDIRKIGEHCPLLNHNAYSIGLVIVGGMNVPSSSELFEDVATASGITLSQFQSLWEFLRVFYNNFPGGQVLGHQDIDVTQEDPGFNVIEYCRAEFGKESIYCDPTKEEAMSVDEIIRHQRVTNINDHFTSITKDDF
jgi:N-acetylmuramoyl-L-alanine amidase